MANLPDDRWMSREERNNVSECRDEYEDDEWEQLHANLVDHAEAADERIAELEEQNEQLQAEGLTDLLIGVAPQMKERNRRIAELEASEAKLVKSLQYLLILGRKERRNHALKHRCPCRWCKAQRLVNRYEESLDV